MISGVMIGSNEVVHSGVYLIPISESNISIKIPETEYTFKISFEEYTENSEEKKDFKRMEILDSNSNMASVLFKYKNTEKHFGSTKKPNNMFYSLEDSDDDEKVKIKIQYQFAIFVEISPRNSLRVNIQITKKPEEKQRVESNG